MSFWSDSSPIVKGMVVLGGIGIIVFALMWAGIGPFASDVDDEEIGQTRGLQ